MTTPNPSTDERDEVVDVRDIDEAPEDTGAGMLVLGGPLTRPPGPAEDADDGAACVECGDGRYDADGYCGTCGAKAADPRDHEELAPAAWVAGVCDRGIRHRSNEDALAVDVREGPRFAALVVCDGVSTANRSAEASRAAAGAALDVLLAGRASDVLDGRGGADRNAALTAALVDATDAAASAVARLTRDAGPAADDSVAHATNPSCTIVAAVVDGDVAVVGSVGDSRAYWFPDAGEPARLTTDDSWAEEQVRLGTDRATAESGPQSHTITRWLGVDAPDHTPVTVTLTVDAPGWLLLCSDGLWNYASEPAQLAEVLRTRPSQEGTATQGADGAAGEPLLLARALVDWANAQGGRDNITAALARLEPTPQQQEPTHA